MIEINKKFNNRINERLLLLAIFVIPLIVFLWRLEDNYMLLLSDDEFCQWANAARLNGDDWSKLCSMKGYYSYFYSFFLAIIYHLCDTAEGMYRAAVILNSILLASISNIAYRICKKIDEQKRPFLWAMIGVSCSLCTANIVYSNLTWTEALLSFITWLIYLMVFEITDESSKGYLGKMVILICLLMLGYMTHQRFWGVLIAGILFVIISAIQRGVDVKKIGIFVLTFVLIAIAHKYIKQDLQNELYLVAQRENIGNDYSSVAGSVVTSVFTFSGIIRTIRVMCGHIFYEGVASLLIGFLGFYETIRRCISSFKTKSIKNAALYFFIFCATTFALGIGVLFMNNPIRIDQLVYGRYAENTYGILLLLGLMRIASVDLGEREFWIPGFVLVALAIIINPMVTALDYGGNIFQQFCCPGVSYYWYKGFDFLHTSLIVVLIYAIIFMASLVLKKWKLKNRKNILAAIAVGMFIFVNIINGLGINNDIIIPLKHQYSGDYDELYSVNNQIEADSEVVYLYYDNSSEPFVHDSPGENAMWLSFLQFCLKDRQLSFEEISADEVLELGNADYIVGAIHNEYLDKFDFEYGGNKFIHLTESEPDGESKLNLDMFYTSGSRQADGLVSNGSENQALMFGPYIKIEKGNYVVKLSIEADSTDAIRIQTDISGNKGLSIFAGYAVSDQDFTDGKAEVVIPFTLEEDCTDFEIRVFTDNVIKVTGVSLAEQ